MFTALIANEFGKMSAGLHDAAENGEAQVVLLIAASGGQRMAMRECRPAPQRPLQSRSGSVLPARVPYQGTLGTGRRRAAPTGHLGVIQHRPPLSLAFALATILAVALATIPARMAPMLAQIRALIG